MKQLIHNDWWDVLKPQFESAYYAQLHNFLKEEYSHRTIYPEMHHIFEAFEWTPFSKVKVVILGQDPYHGPHQAHGWQLFGFARDPCSTIIAKYL